MTSDQLVPATTLHLYFSLSVSSCRFLSSMSGPSFSSSSSRARSSSPFGQRRPLTSSYSSSSSSASSFMNGRLFPRSSPSSASSHFYGSSGVRRSVTPNRGHCDYASNLAPSGFVSGEELVMDAGDAASSTDSIIVTVRFRPLR